MEQRVQIIVDRDNVESIWFPRSKRGDVVWVSQKAARELLEQGVCRWPGPSETPMAGPTETKEAPKKRPFRRADGWPIDRFCIIERTWEAETVVCIGGGPSLTAEIIERIRVAHEAGLARVIAVNDAYLVAPWADLCYFADSRWWKWHTDGIAKKYPWVSFTAEQVKAAFASFAGQKVTIFNTGMMVADPGVFMLHNDSSRSGQPDGLSEAPNGIRTGSNGGYQAINIAVLAGGNPILLLGYDMRFQGGRSHSHNGHPIKHNESAYLGYAKNFSSMLPQLKKLGVEVLNCTPGSAIKAFPIVPLEEALCRVPSS